MATVAEFIGKKGQFEFLDTNVAGASRVMITLHSDDKSKKPLPCLLSTTLSKEFRAKTLSTKHILGLEYMLGANDVYYITRPQGKAYFRDVDTKDTIAYEMEEINMEELIAL